jgi:hypothetical protein
MERATQKDERGYYLVGDGIYSDEGTPEKFRGDDVDRLAAYEDTGLEPCDYSAMAHALEQAERAREDLTEMIRQIGATGLDRLRELAQADREGRCVVLPFKPPRWVYVCSTRFPKPAQAHYASAINVLQDMDKGCVFGDTQEEAAAALRRKLE